MGDLAARAARGWRAFGRWRGTRPFWGGLLLILAGLEMFGSTQGGGINGLSVHVGPSGYLSWLIPGVLATCGLLIWFTPAQHMFYAVIGAITSVFSLMAINLGGFFVGLVLGGLGSALAFGWAPPGPATPAAGDGHADDEAVGSGDETAGVGDTARIGDGGPAAGDDGAVEPTGPKADGDGGPDDTGPAPGAGTADQERPRRYGETPALRPAVAPDAAPSPRSRGRTRWFSVWILIVAAGGAVLPGAGAAHAAACPTASPSASPSASRSPGPIDGLIGDIAGGIGELLGLGGKRSPSPSPSASGDAEEECGGPEPPGAGPGQPDDPGDPGRPGDTGAPGSPVQPGEEPAGEEPREEVKQLGVPEGVPPVAMRPSLLTGSKVEMWNLGMDGIVDMPRVDGTTIKALQFSMTRAYTHDFTLQTPRHQELSPITSSKLGVEGDVRFYATRFTGSLLGIPITLTPESPIPPDGIPIALPYIAFQDPSMELLLATCDTLTGPDLVDVV
ncbi:DUF6114 domain-containing protein [Catenuloplanes atrovinosus]|uniref:Uncharacterized protein n=1 Tax=Catenuloplanes atrovinosus TaxID=137266 RepID=A0AAE3YTX2_9ACTN|nr:DUF6114 domain-containing protein [Catenuloplanes atrovinosus]MDR7279863.1 hypothetical protein [Catenuloplanes atrovinosus]